MENCGGFNRDRYPVPCLSDPVRQRFTRGRLGSLLESLGQTICREGLQGFVVYNFTWVSEFEQCELGLCE